jgi:putative oxidoreductase
VKVLQVVLALALGAVFIYASIDKIRDPRAFARIVYHYQVVGPGARIGFVPANTLAVTLPWVEAVTGALLITGVWRREAALVTSLLLAVFLAAAGSALARGIDIENCGCFALSGEGRRAGWRLLAEDAAMLAAALLVTAARPRDRLRDQAAAAAPAR